MNVIKLRQTSLEYDAEEHSLEGGNVPSKINGVHSLGTHQH